MPLDFGEERVGEGVPLLQPFSTDLFDDNCCGTAGSIIAHGGGDDGGIIGTVDGMNVTVAQQRLNSWLLAVHITGDGFLKVSMPRTPPPY